MVTNKCHNQLLTGARIQSASPPLKRDSSALVAHCLAGHLVFIPPLNSDPQLQLAASARVPTEVFSRVLGLVSLVIF